MRRLRASKLTQQQLEALTGIDIKYIRKIERGTVNITLDTLRDSQTRSGSRPEFCCGRRSSSYRGRGDRVSVWRGEIFGRSFG